jgi:polar amino acid transport system substrate-binding protein
MYKKGILGAGRGSPRRGAIRAKIEIRPQKNRKKSISTQTVLLFMHLFPKERILTKKPILFAVLVSLFFRFTLAAQQLSIMAEENPPFNSQSSGESQGAATDLFLAIAQKAGLTIARSDVKTVPWARGYEAVQKEPNTILFPMARTPAREALVNWIGPFYKVKIGLIAPKAKGLKIPDGAAAAKYKIGTVRDGAPEQAAIAAAIPVDVLERGNDLVSNLKKLQAGRIDMIAFNATAASFNMASLGMNPADYEVVLVFSEPQLYFAVSKATPDATVKSLQTALDILKADGSYAAIIQKFIP